MLEITPAKHLSLNPLQLQRLGLVKVPVSVSWSDGKPEPDAYLLVHQHSVPGTLGTDQRSNFFDSDRGVHGPIMARPLAGALRAHAHVLTAHTRRSLALYCVRSQLTSVLRSTS